LTTKYYWNRRTPTLLVGSASVLKLMFRWLEMIEQEIALWLQQWLSADTTTILERPAVVWKDHWNFVWVLFCEKTPAETTSSANNSGRFEKNNGLKNHKVRLKHRKTSQCRLGPKMVKSAVKYVHAWRTKESLCRVGGDWCFHIAARVSDRISWSAKVSTLNRTLANELKDISSINIWQIGWRRNYKWWKYLLGCSDAKRIDAPRVHNAFMVTTFRQLIAIHFTCNENNGCYNSELFIILFIILL